MFLITMLSCIWQKCLWMFGLSSFASSLPTKLSQIINSSSFSTHNSQCIPRVFNTSSVEIKATLQLSQWVPGCRQWPCEAGTPTEGQCSYTICQLIQAKPKWLPKKTQSFGPMKLFRDSLECRQVFCFCFYSYHRTYSFLFLLTSLNFPFADHIWCGLSMNGWSKCTSSLLSRVRLWCGLDQSEYLFWFAPVIGFKLVKRYNSVLWNSDPGNFQIDWEEKVLFGPFKEEQLKLPGTSTWPDSEWVDKTGMKSYKTKRKSKLFF